MIISRLSAQSLFQQVGDEFVPWDTLCDHGNLKAAIIKNVEAIVLPLLPLPEFDSENAANDSMHTSSIFKQDEVIARIREVIRKIGDIHGALESDCSSNISEVEKFLVEGGFPSKPEQRENSSDSTSSAPTP